MHNEPSKTNPTPPAASSAAAPPAYVFARRVRYQDKDYAKGDPVPADYPPDQIENGLLQRWLAKVEPDEKPADA